MDDLRLRPADRVAAFRRPGIVLLVYLYRAAVALLVASPLAAVAADVVGRAPRGDAALFDRGGLVLLETLRLARASVAALTLQGGTVVLLASFFGLVPLAALLVALGREGKLALGSLLPRATRRLGTLALLFGLALLAQVVAAGLMTVLCEGAVTRLGTTAPRADALRAFGAILTLAIVLSIGVVHDLARVVAVHRDAGVYASVSMALGTARRRAGGAALAYGWRGAVTLAVLVGSALVAAREGAESPRALFVALGAHQAAVLFAVALRASWLAWGIRAVEAVNPRQPWEEEPGEVVDLGGVRAVVSEPPAEEWRRPPAPPPPVPDEAALPIGDEDLLPAGAGEVKAPRAPEATLPAPKVEAMFPPPIDEAKLPGGSRDD